MVRLLSPPPPNHAFFYKAFFGTERVTKGQSVDPGQNREEEKNHFLEIKTRDHSNISISRHPYHLVQFRCVQFISKAFLICQASTTGTPPNRTADPLITSRMLYHRAYHYLLHSGLFYARIFKRLSLVQCFISATFLVLTTLNSPMIESTQLG